MSLAFLSLVCFTIFGLFFKLSSQKQCNQIAVNTATLLFAAIVSVLAFLVSRHQSDSRVILFGICGGTFLFLTFIFLLYALRDGKISTCWTIYNFGMVIPVILSVFIWKETMDAKKITGFILICFSIILIGQDNK